MKNKTILITGGTGSLGKKIISILLKKYNLKKIIIFSRDEQKQFSMQQKFNDNRLRFFIGDIRDKDRLFSALNGVDYVIHAAALKHVEVGEYNPFETIKTNIIGAQNIIEVSILRKVKKIIALSTDKASSPSNLYGATKLVSDKLFSAANNYAGSNDIKFSSVRYGNVFGSRGSIVPLLLSPKLTTLNLTDERMTRFNITLNESALFVLSCLKDMLGGEIFIPKISSYKILDLIKAVNPKVKIKITGLRSGEKLNEEMISQNDAINTIELKDRFIICPSSNFNYRNKQYFLKTFKKSKSCAGNFSYTSEKNIFLTHKKISRVLRDNLEDIEINVA